MHPLLKSQLDQAGLLTDTPPSEEFWPTFLNRISTAYLQADNDRIVLEQAANLAMNGAEQARSKDQKDSELDEEPEACAEAILTALPDTTLLFDQQLQLLSAQNMDLLVEPRLRDKLRAHGLSELAGALGVEAYAELVKALKSVMRSDKGCRFVFDLILGEETQQFEARLLPVNSNGFVGASVLIRDWTSVSGDGRSSRIYRDLFDAASEGMMLLDSKQKVLLVNRAFEIMRGQSAEELTALETIEFHDSEGDSLNTELWSNVFYDRNWAGEATFVHADGLRQPVWLTVDALGEADSETSMYLVHSSDVSKLKSTQDKLAHFATHDQLTGLPNRAFFQDHLAAAIQRSQRSGNSGALFFMDLDNFKGINDTLGHPVGDALLLEMSKRLNLFVRESELVSRIGGDEFTLVVENLAQTEDAAIVAQRVLKEFDEPFVCDGRELDMSCSIGITIFPQDGDNRDKLIKQADTAMYSAKQAGRNTFKFYTSELTHIAVQSFNMETQLRRAIERDELFLNFQPQVDMKGRKLLGAEVLLRWNNEQYGMVSPAEFIPLAEASGLIETIGEWVLDSACQQISHWEQITGVPCPISVNVSRKQLVRPDFVKRVAATLAKHNVKGTQLEIEVTESAIATSERIAIKNLHGVRELGCQISIDDFGTGYSSLSSLQKFPLDRLKIDRSFVMGLGNDPNADAIIAAIIALAKTLGLGVIAEGVETQQQVKALVKKGCREAQGFYYSKPLLASDFREFVLKTRRA